MIFTIFNEALVRPLFNALVIVLNILPFGGFGFSIIVLTLAIRFILYPLSRKSIASQKAMQELQPEIQEIKDRFKDDKEGQSRAMMELYKERGVNPFSGCLPLLVQLPILLALYRVFLGGFDASQFEMLYSFVSAPGSIDTMFLGLIDLSERSVILALIVGALQFFQSRQVMNMRGADSTSSGDDGPNFQAMMGKQMTYVMPLITTGISWSLPAALPLYWMTTTLFSIVQHRIVVVSVSTPEKQ